MKMANALILILVMFLWAICFPLISAGISSAPHMSFAAIRALLAGGALVALAFALGRPIPTGIRIWINLVFVGLGATTLGFFGMFHAAEFVSPGFATVIANTQPLLAAVLASAFLGEHLDRSGKFGMALSFCGIILITVPQLMASTGDSYAVGLLYIVIAALGITVSNVLIKRISGEVDVLMAMGIQMLIGALPLVGLAWIIEQPQEIIWSNRFIIVLVGLSLPGTALVYWLWFSVLQRIRLNQANAFSFLIPVFGLSMGMLFYGESIGWLEATGIALIVLGIVFVNPTIMAKAMRAANLIAR